MMNIKKLFENKFFAGGFIFICLIIIGLVFFMPEIIGQYIKRFGIKLTPCEAVEPLSRIVYLQNDERWKDVNLAETKDTLASHGCLTCVIAADLCYMGYDVLPTDVNTAFIENDAYTKNGLLIWYKINSAYEDVEYHYEKVFDSQTISNDLQNGRLPIVKVRYKRRGIFHWVLVVGAEEDCFLVLDPLEQSEEPIPLDIHGRVYAYRVLTEND